MHGLKPFTRPPVPKLFIVSVHLDIMRVRASCFGAVVSMAHSSRCFRHLLNQQAGKLGPRPPAQSGTPLREQQGLGHLHYQRRRCLQPHSGWRTGQQCGAAVRLHHVAAPSRWLPAFDWPPMLPVCHLGLRVQGHGNLSRTASHDRLARRSTETSTARSFRNRCLTPFAGIQRLLHGVRVPRRIRCDAVLGVSDGICPVLLHKGASCAHRGVNHLQCTNLDIVRERKQ